MKKFCWLASVALVFLAVSCKHPASSSNVDVRTDPGHTDQGHTDGTQSPTDCKVTIMNGEEIFAEMTVKEGEFLEDLTELPVNEDPSYEFDGIWSEQDGKGYCYLDKDGKACHEWDMKGETATLWAFWIDKGSDKISLAKDVINNGGRINDEAMYSYRQSASDQTFALTVPAKTGYDAALSVIKTDGAGEPKIEGETLTIPANTWGDFSIKVAWIAQTYGITYKDKGGDDFSGTHGENAPTQHTYDTKTTLVEPTKENYKFLGWHLKADCSDVEVTFLGAEAWTKEKEPVLYAKWEIFIKGDASAVCAEIAKFNDEATKGEELEICLTGDSIEGLKDAISAHTGDVHLDLSQATITELQNAAFQNCSSLVEIKLPETLETIGETAFLSCGKLSYIKIPKSVIEIGKSAFLYAKLTKAEFEDPDGWSAYDQDGKLSQANITLNESAEDTAKKLFDTYNQHTWTKTSSATE